MRKGDGKVTSSNPLGDFLRARRARLDPAGFDLPDVGRRRNPGLRRREVAYLAGVSTPYYARLEQGTDRSPSPSVLQALARVLRLDGEATAHLHRLAAPAPTAPGRAAPGRADEVAPALSRLVLGFTDEAAIVINRYRDVLLANDLATALNPAFRAGENLLRHAFLDPAARDIYLDWDDVVDGAVAGLRAMNSGNPDDPRLIELVGELSVKSPAFREKWARHEVRTRRDGRKRYRTARGGVVSVDYQAFTVTAADGQTLFVFSAAPGTADAAALEALRPGPAAAPPGRRHARRRGA
jgi:transcriptional regulator with XRE-family HTH domain